MPSKAAYVVYDDPKGTVFLEQADADSPVKVTGEFIGLSKGLQGFHVHEFGHNTKGCISTGPYFSPYIKKHGAPADENRHLRVGDLGNIEASGDRPTKVEISDKKISLFGAKAFKPYDCCPYRS